ncbi:MAG: multicomponent Na+:H+ antiporter subunit C [Cellvibrionaceae bacterium]|jgi:multicomponent Na+:H+ antiporter subunit C
MNVLLAAVIGFLYATGVFMVLRRSIVKLILGIGLLGNATNLLLFTIGDVSRSVPPIIHTGETTLAADAANPIPQALILTAIVIGMAMTAYAVVLAKQAYQVTKSDDVDEMLITDV